MQAVPGGPKPAPGVNVILDLVGASHFAGNLESLTIEGKLLLVGMPSGMKAEINLATVSELYNTCQVGDAAALLASVCCATRGVQCQALQQSQWHLQLFAPPAR